MPIFFPIIAAAALLGVVVGFSVTWWTTPEEHKFRHILQDFFRDVRDIFRLDALFAFLSRAGNLAFGGVATLATVIATTPELKAALLNSGPWGLIAFAVACFTVTLQMRSGGQAHAAPRGTDLGGDFSGVNPHGGPQQFARAEYAR